MRRLLACVLFMSCTCCAVAQNLGQKRAITEKDLFDFHWIGDTQMSPDGRTVAFVQTMVAPDHSGYQTALYLLDLTVPGATPRLLTPGTHDSRPRWSPDGASLAFLRSSEKEGKPQPPQLYLTTLAPHASPIRLSDLPRGVGDPQWKPDGKGLAVVSDAFSDSPKVVKELAERGRATGDPAHVSDVRIIDKAMYQLNGAGFLDSALTPQVYFIYLPGSDGSQRAANQLTDQKYGVQEYTWNATAELIFAAQTEAEPYYRALPHTSLFSGFVSMAERHKTIPLPIAELPLGIQGIVLSPDGKHLAFHAQQLPVPPAAPVSHQESDLWILDLTPRSEGSLHVVAKGAPRNLTAAQGFEMGGGVGGDNVAPRGSGHAAIHWSADGKQLLDVAGSQGSALLLSVDADSGEITKLSARQQAVLNFAASADAKTIVALISNPILIGDLFRIDPAGKPAGPKSGSAPAGAGNQTQLTHSNDALFAQLDLEMPHELKVTPTTGLNDIPFLTIDTFVQLPPHFDAMRKYPLILNIHGGPHSAYGWVFDHEMLFMAAQGYVVDYPNPRGSTTYGQKFANVIENNYPGDDFHDLMDTVDAVIAKGWADPAKLGVTGGSGGGLLTDWVVTHTDRFKAAVAQRDIVDAAAWWYTADINEFHQYWWPGAPFASAKNLELYKRLSPLTYIDAAKTPEMFILGDADTRTPPTSGGEVFFRALKYKCVPTVMVRFPRETHELSRSGEPWHRVERLENIVDWFDLYLQGKPQPQYDTTVSPACQTERAAAQ